MKEQIEELKKKEDRLEKQMAEVMVRHKKILDQDSFAIKNFDKSFRVKIEN